MFRSLVRILLLAMLAAAQLCAQATGRIEGLVVDPNDAAVPGAQVVCRNVATGLTYQAVSNVEGIFRFPDVPIGSYEIAVSKDGFQKLVRGGIDLLTGHTVDLKLPMTIGAVTQSVEVSGEVPLVQTATSEVQTTIDSRAMSELPLNGRNPLELVVLTPGAAFTSLGTSVGQQDNTGVTVNGLRATDNNFQLDGAGFNNPMYGSAPTLPNPDTLSEFTVQSSNFSARESAGGALVQLSTRSGTNRLSGSVFNFLRNDKMDARNFFAARVSQFKRNQGGASLGGPIKRNRMFFFASYQATVKRGSPSPRLLTVPSLAQRDGIFPANNAIYDPLTKQPFPGNVIPRSRFDANTPRLIPYIPLPSSGANVAEVPTASNQDDHQLVGKVDLRYGGGNNLSVRYYYDHNDIQRDTNSVPGVYSMNAYGNQSLTVRDTHNLTPRITLVNSLSYSRTFRSQVAYAPIYTMDLSSGVVAANSRAKPELRVLMSNYFDFNSGGPLAFHPSYWEWRNQTAWSHGAHLIGFGVDIYRGLEIAEDNSSATGQFQFTALRTGDAAGKQGDTFASVLLGLPNSFQENATDLARLRQERFHFWFQDDWKIRPRLTLNLGVRWEPTLSPVDTNGKLAGFLPGVQSRVAPRAPLGLVFSGDVDDAIIPPDWKTLAPRAGFAWDISGSGKTVMRAGYGIYYRVLPLAFMRSVGNSGPFRALKPAVSDVYSFSDPWRNYPGGNPFPYSFPTGAALLTWQFPARVSGLLIDPNVKSGYTQSWNFTLERQVLRDTTVSLAYVGNHSIRIPATREANPAIYGPGATSGNVDSRRLYPGFSSVTMCTDWNRGNYQSLQISVTKRARRGLSVISNYVFGKTIDLGSGGTIGGSQTRSPFNWNADRGPADTDIAHLLNLALLYDLPRLIKGSRWGGAFVNGWQLNGILTARSGYPFNVTAGDRALVAGAADFADLVAGVSTKRPAGVDPVRKWFNTAAFVLPPLGSFGMLGRNVMRGPGSAVVNFSSFKNFRATERWSVQFRFEAFNFFNRPNFSNPQAGVGGVTFGQILGAADPRVLQMGLKLLF